jgi:hypothetical protein
MVEATSQLQANHVMSATRSVHNAVRHVSQRILSSKCPVAAEGFLPAGTRIAASNRSRLGSRIEADRCNQRTNINASGIGVSQRTAVSDYTVGVVTTQSNSIVKFPVVT